MFHGGGQEEPTASITFRIDLSSYVAKVGLRFGVHFHGAALIGKLSQRKQDYVMFEHSSGRA